MIVHAWFFRSLQKEPGHIFTHRSIEFLMETVSPWMMLAAMKPVSKRFDNNSGTITSNQTNRERQTGELGPCPRRHHSVLTGRSGLISAENRLFSLTLTHRSHREAISKTAFSSKSLESRTVYVSLLRRRNLPRGHPLVEEILSFSGLVTPALRPDLLLWSVPSVAMVKLRDAWLFYSTAVLRKNAVRIM